MEQIDTLLSSSCSKLSTSMVSDSVNLLLKETNRGRDILFVVPAFAPKMKEESLGTLILAKKAQTLGFNVDIIRYWEITNSIKDDYEAFKKEFINTVITCNPKVLSFYCRCEEYHISLDLASGIKNVAPDIFIVFGGPQAELVSAETISQFPCVDYICCSEGENTIGPLLEFLCRNHNETNICQGDIPGLVYRNCDGTVVRNAMPEMLADNYIMDDYYYDLLPAQILEDCISMPIDVGRGCPFSCVYCSTKTFWKQRFRLRKLADTVTEMQYVVKHFGITQFDFMHDLFTVNKKRILEFCSEITKRGLKIQWGCDSRIDTIDFEMIDVMFTAGLRNIFFGIESGSERMQKNINKNLNLKKCRDVVDYCLSKGLKVTTSFMYGFPEETTQDLSDTLKMIVEFQNKGCNVLTNLCHVMNGTELYNRYSNDLIINKGTAYNKCIPAFDELFNLIRRHKAMFANFCDFPAPIRDQMKYVDVFRYSLAYANNHMAADHEYLIDNDYASYEMYMAFCDANTEVFNEHLLASNGDVTSIRRTFKYTSRDVYESLINNLVKKLASK